MTLAAQGRERAFTGADGNRLVAEVWGAGPPVLLLHGGGQTRHSWERTCRRLAASGLAAIALDLRGHGDSDWSPDGTYGLPTHARDVLAVCAALPVRPSLVGASMGGASALLAIGGAAAGGAELASSLVLVDVTPTMASSGVARIRDFMLDAPDGFASIDEAAEAVARYQPDRSRPRSAAGLVKNLRLRDDGRYHWHWDPRILEELSDDPGALRGAMVRAAREVRIPSLAVRGGRSDVVSPEAVRELLGLIPGCEFTEVSAAGHMVAGADNDVFSQAIAEFVGRFAYIDIPPSTGRTTPVM
jgi:pimeloyl-ACP methyl ester carboxylesterase